MTDTEKYPQAANDTELTEEIVKALREIGDKINQAYDLGSDNAAAEQPACSDQEGSSVDPQDLSAYANTQQDNEFFAGDSGLLCRCMATTIPGLTE